MKNLLSGHFLILIIRFFFLKPTHSVLNLEFKYCIFNRSSYLLFKHCRHNPEIMVKVKDKVSAKTKIKGKVQDEGYGPGKRKGLGLG